MFRFDSHLFMREINQQKQKNDIQCITKEKKTFPFNMGTDDLLIL